MPSSTVVAAGSVRADGTINTLFPRYGATWSVNHAGAGVYLVTIPGLNPGCVNIVLPLMLVTSNEFSAGSQGTVNFGSVSCGSGDTNMQVNSWNSAGTAADRAFTFIAYRPGTGQILPAAAAHPGATTCTVHSDGSIDCV